MTGIVARLLHRAPVLVVLLLPTLPAAASPDVLASIKPVHSVVAAIMAGIAEPQLLIDGAASPHSFELRPSQARALHEADLLVLAGAGLEPFERRLDGGAGPRILRMSDLAGMRLRPLGAPGPGHDHDEGEHGHPDEAPPPAGEAVDPHLWLDPMNMGLLAAHVADALAELDPEHAGRYRANLERLENDLRALDRLIEQRLEPLRARPFVVGHDAYGYFTSRYRLRQVGVVALAPERGPGARTLRALREQVEALAPLCVFHEPGMAPDLLRTLGDGVEVAYGELDPLGTTLQPGPDQYPAVLRALTENFAACLGRLPPQPG